jgi:hypothetical protein
LKIFRDEDGDLWLETKPDSGYFYVAGDDRHDGTEPLATIEKTWGPLTEMKLVEA